MEKCPHCGENSGYYVKMQVRGAGVYYYNFDGVSAEDNSSLQDALNYQSGKWAYCTDCNKRLFRVDKQGV